MKTTKKYRKEYAVQVLKQTEYINKTECNSLNPENVFLCLDYYAILDQYRLKKARKKDFKRFVKMQKEHLIIQKRLQNSCKINL